MLEDIVFSCSLLASRLKSVIVDKKGNSALLIAAQAGRADVVKTLLEKGADRLVQNVDKPTSNRKIAIL